ncbi:MAG: DNA repair protein RecO [Candidatus Aminicenantes bacterium]|nr:DNA repair protein RecO [Candidatus Aminicenantes bacterium]
MPLDKSEAIILRTQNLGEQDKLVVFFSREKGLIKGVAKGARKFNNRFGSSLEPFSVVKMLYYEKERHDLVTISNCDLLESSFELYCETKTTWALAYVAELVEKFSPYREKEEVLYRLLLSFIKALKEGQRLEYLIHYFEFWFLKINGILPDWSTCHKCHRPLAGQASLNPQRDGFFCLSCAEDRRLTINQNQLKALDWIRKKAPFVNPEINLSEEEWKQLGRVFQAIIIYNLEETLRTLNFIDF